jgi:hypothetical protein
MGVQSVHSVPIESLAQQLQDGPVLATCCGVRLGLSLLIKKVWWKTHCMLGPDQFPDVSDFQDRQLLLRLDKVIPSDLTLLDDAVKEITAALGCTAYVSLATPPRSAHRPRIMAPAFLSNSGT